MLHITRPQMMRSYSMAMMCNMVMQTRAWGRAAGSA